MTQGEAAAVMRQWIDEAAARIEPLRGARGLRLAVAMDVGRMHQVALLESVIAGGRDPADVDLDALAGLADEMMRAPMVGLIVPPGVIRPSEIAAAIWVGLEFVLLGLEDG